VATSRRPTEEDTTGKRDVSIPTPDGTMDAGLHTPEGSGPWTGVIMYPDAGGVRRTFDDMAQRLADLGDAVLVPNFYDRLGEVAPFDMETVFSDPDERKRLMTLVGSVSREDSTLDTQAMLEFLAAQPDVADSAADRPHLLAGSMRAAVYVAAAEDDGSFDAEQFDRLSAALTEAGVDHTLLTYPALHGFAVPDDPMFDDQAAERHWQALQELYAEALVPG
jgi:carboxymethylenebutenolidase